MVQFCRPNGDVSTYWLAEDPVLPSSSQRTNRRVPTIKLKLPHRNVMAQQARAQFMDSVAYKRGGSASTFSQDVARMLANPHCNARSRRCRQKIVSYNIDELQHQYQDQLR